MPGLSRMLQATAGTGGFVGAYDDIPDLVHLYELARRGLSSYEGPLVRIRRSSDNVQQDFGYVENGDLDTAAIATFIGGGSGFIVTVYDQVGSNNLTQATPGSQPAYVKNTQNGKPAMRFASDAMEIAFSSSLSQPSTVYCGSKASSTGTSNFMVDGADGSNRHAMYMANSTPIWQMFAGTALTSVHEADTDVHLFAGLFNGANSRMWRDGASISAGNAGTQAMAGVAVGARQDGASGWPGDIFMVAVVNPAHDDAERFAMETAVNDYWGMFRFRFTLISRSNDLGIGGIQSPAYDGTYYYATADNSVYRFTRSGATYTLDTSQSFLANMPGGTTQINGMNIYDGYIWAGVSNFATVPGASWIMQIDLATLTFVANHALDDAHWTEGGAWYGGDYWAIFHDWDRVARYRFVASVWTKIDDYLLPLVEGLSTGLYQGATWYNDGADDYLVSQTHQSLLIPETHFHKWTGTEFEAAGFFPAFEREVGQGLHWEVPGSIMLFAERDPGGAGQTIIRATLTDDGPVAPSGLLLESGDFILLETGDGMLKE